VKTLLRLDHGASLQLTGFKSGTKTASFIDLTVQLLFMLLVISTGSRRVGITGWMVQLLLLVKVISIGTKKDYVIEKTGQL
jgi:hypothetical protein